MLRLFCRGMSYAQIADAVSSVISRSRTWGRLIEPAPCAWRALYLPFRSPIMRTSSPNHPPPGAAPPMPRISQRQSGTIPCALQQAPGLAARSQVLHFALGRLQLAEGPVQSPGYIRQSNDRLCEPRFQRSTALSGVRVYAQDYLGTGIVPTPQPGYKLTLNTLAHVRPPGLLL